MEISSLLDQIIANTSDQDPTDSVILVETAEEFLAMAKQSEAEPIENPPKSAKERYYHGIFRELFKEAKFFHAQYKAIHEAEFPEDKIEVVTNRLEIILESINESFPVIKPYLMELLKSDDSQDLELTMFVLSSLGAINDHTGKKRSPLNTSGEKRI